MKNEKYHTVGTLPKSNRKVEETETKSITLWMAAHFHGYLYTSLWMAAHFHGYI
jgi:hypothetical protein